MMLKGATSVAAVAAIGNLLQGWDGGAIAGKGQLIIYVDLNHASYWYHTNEYWHFSSEICHKYFISILCISNYHVRHLNQQMHRVQQDAYLTHSLSQLNAMSTWYFVATRICEGAT